MWVPDHLALAGDDKHMQTNRVTQVLRADRKDSEKHWKDCPELPKCLKKCALPWACLISFAMRVLKGALQPGRSFEKEIAWRPWLCQESTLLRVKSIFLSLTLQKCLDDAFTEYGTQT